MIVPYGVAFDLRWGQRQAGDDHTHETFSGKVDALAEDAASDGKGDACTSIRMAQCMQIVGARPITHARRLAQHVGCHGSLLEFGSHRQSQGFEKAESRHEHQMVSGPGLGNVDDQSSQRRRRPLPGCLPQVEIRNQQYPTVVGLERTRQPQSMRIGRQAEGRIQQVHGSQRRGEQNEAMPAGMFPCHGRGWRQTAKRHTPLSSRLVGDDHTKRLSVLTKLLPGPEPTQQCAVHFPHAGKQPPTGRLAQPIA